MRIRLDTAVNLKRYCQTSFARLNAEAMSAYKWRTDREITPLVVRRASAESYIGRGSESSEKRRAAPVVTFLGIFLRQWKLETTESSDRGDHLLLGARCFLVLNPSPHHFMHPTRHQMLNEVVKDNRDHDTRIGGEDE